MIDVLKIIKFSFFKIWLIMLWFLLALSPNLNADTLGEVLRLTFSSNESALKFEDNENKKIKVINQILKILNLINCNTSIIFN